MKRLFTRTNVISLCTLLAMQVMPIATINAYDIAGNAQIARAPIGKTAAVKYAVDGTDAIWSVSGAPSGVEITHDGVLLVPGETVLSGNNVEITVTAKDESGSILAEKTVDLLNKINYDKSTANYNYVDFPKRSYVNFEVQEVDTAPTDRLLLGNSWDDVPLRFNAIGTSGTEPCVIKQEANGNKYVSASGTKSWSNGGTTFRNFVKFTPETALTFYARFMIEDNTEKSNPYSLIYFENSSYDIRYAPISENETGLYLYMENGADVTPELLTTVTPGEWFEFWIEYDIVNNTLSMFADGKKIIDNRPYTRVATDILRFGAAIDDMAYFSGTYAPAAFPDTLAEEVYLTESMSEAVLELDSSMLYGKYAVSDKAKHEIVGDGAYVSENKLFIPAGGENVTVSSKEIKEKLSKVTEDDASGSNAEYAVAIQTPPSYGIEKTRTITKKAGLEFSYDDGVSGTSSGSAEAIGGILDASTGFAVYSVDAKGRLMLSFDYLGDLNVTLSDGITNTVISGKSADKMTDTQIFVDTQADEYFVFTDGEQLATGELVLSEIKEITFSQMKLDNFIFSSINATKPYALNPTVSGIGAVGQTLSADYAYYSPWGGKMKSADVKWFASNAEDGNYTQVGSGEEFTAPEEIADKYLKYSVSVSDEKNTGTTIFSEAKYIKDVFTLSKDGDNLKVEIQNSVGDDGVILGIMLYSGDTAETILTDVTLSGESVDKTIPLNGADGAVVSLMYRDTLLPVAASKSIGTVKGGTETAEGEEKILVKDGSLSFKTDKETMATVMVYANKASESNFTDKYSELYEKDEVLKSAERENSKNQLAYINVVKTTEDTTKVNLPKLKSGSFRAVVIPRSEEEFSYLYMEDAASLLVKDKMELDGFLKVLKLYSEKDDSDVEEIYELFNTLEDKENVEKFLKTENYNVDMFDLAVLLFANLENTQDTEIYKLLIQELEAKEKETVGAELLALDADSSITAEVILESDWESSDELLQNLYEKSVLYGIYHVRNYMEADEFLKTLTDTDYQESKYREKICSYVSGELYDSLEELKDEIEGFKPEEKGSGGSGGGGGSNGKISSKVNVETSGSVNVSKTVFSDVSESHWANEAITYLSERKVLNGNPDGSFSPEKQITRAEFVKVICEAFGLYAENGIDFADVESGSWYEKYCKIASKLEIIKGDGEFFRPNDNITREDTAIIIYRVLSYCDIEMKEEGRSFADSDKISGYAQNAVGSLAAMGIISGMDNNCFCPKEQMTRAQCAQIVANCLRGYGL